MPRLSGGNNVSRIRNLALGATIILTVYILLQSFNIRPHDIGHATRQSLGAISHLRPESWRSHAPRITKVTSLFGEDNELYEAAIRSHEEHDRLHGYELRLFREKIVEKYWSIPTLLLGIMVEELAKPSNDRTEWLMWVAPDVMILNPQVPLEIFLPPKDFGHAGFLGTQDEEGFNYGVFFLRVHEWSVMMLLEVISIPKDDFGNSPGASQKALERVLRSDRFRGSVFYQPRAWYNAYQSSASEFEGKSGDLLVHFHGLGGDKWRAMADTIAKKSGSKRTWSVSLAQTSYETEIEEYWNRIRTAHDLLAKAQPHMTNPSVDSPFRRLQFATTYEVDNVDVMNSAMENLKDAIGIQ